MMDFETASECCSTAGSGCIHSNSNVTREGNTLPARQAVGMDLPTSCLPGSGEQENDGTTKVKYNLMSPEGRKCDSVEWGRVTPPGEREACNSSEKRDSTSSDGSKSTGYTVRETQRAGHVDDLTRDGARSPLTGTSAETPTAVRAVKTGQTPTPTENPHAPGQRLTAIESAETVTLGAIAGVETDESAAISSSIVWTEFLNVSIPANVRGYEELFRCCVSPAASASPTSTGKPGSTGADQGNASLSRYETLSTQPSHPRLHADDVADDSSPPFVPAALLVSEPEQEDVQHHSSVSVGVDGKTDELGAATSELKTDIALDPPGQEQAKHVAAGIAAENVEVVKHDGPRNAATCYERNNDTTSFDEGAVVRNTEERKGPSSLHVINRIVQEYATSVECDTTAAVQSPFCAAVAAVSPDTGRASQCTFVPRVASGITSEKDGLQGNSEEATRASVSSGSTEKNDAMSPKCGGPPAVTRQTSCILPPTPPAEAKTVRFDSITGECDSASRPTTYVVPPPTASSQLVSVKVRTDKTGGEGQPAEAEMQVAYPPASDSGATRCSAEEVAVVGCDDLGTSAVGDARRNGPAASQTDATPAAPVAPPGTATSGESRMPRGAVVGGEDSAPVGPRGRPSLGAAGRQLLLDRIRAKYHTNVGLYSGVLRKNYNSTISKLPFFTVSLLHQLAADFGIDTNAVLEQQQQQHYDSTRGSSTRHNAETGYPTGGRGARQGTFVGPPQARGGAAGSGGAFYLRNPVADKRALTIDSQGASAYTTTGDKRRGRLHYESLSRRRCTRRTTKKSGSTSDGGLGSSPGERGESVCPARGARRRSLGLRTNRASWEPEMIDSSPRRTQGNFLIGENMRTQGGVVSSEQDTREQQRKGEKEHERRNFDEYAGGRVVSCVREEAAPESETWTENRALSAEVSSISTASGTIVRARAVAIEKRREEPGQLSSTAHDEPHCSSGSSCSAAIQLLGSSLERAAGDTVSQDKWRTVAELPLLVREGREQRRLLTALNNMEESEEKEKRKLVGEVRVLRSRSFEGTSPTRNNEHSKWFSGVTVPNRLPAADSFREHQQRSAVETYTGTFSYLRRPAAGDAAFSLWPRDGRVTNAATVAPAEEKRRTNYPSPAPFVSNGSDGTICGSAVDDGDTLRTQNILKENMSACELPQARYLWSVLFGQLPEESGRALHSAGTGQELWRTPAGGEKCDEAGLECRAGSEKCALYPDTADVSPSLTLMARERREMHSTSNLHLAIAQPSEVLAAVSTTAATSGVRSMGERVPLCRSREWVPRVGPANNENSYEQNTTDGVSGAFAAVSGSDTGVLSARVTEVERLLGAGSRPMEAEHLRKRLKTELVWSQPEDELHNTRPVLHPHPASSSHGTRNYLPGVDLQDSSVVGGDRRNRAGERILELLNRRGEGVSQGGGGGPREAEPRDAANAGFLQKTSTSTFKRGATDGQLQGDRIDCKPFAVTSIASEDPFSAGRLREGEGILTCTQEREEGWREPMHVQQKSPFAARARNNCNNVRETSAQTEGRLTGAGGLRIPFASLTGDEDTSQRYQNGLNSSLLLLQQQEQCRGKTSLAPASWKQPTLTACGSGEHTETLEGYPGNSKSAHKRNLVEPWWSETLDVKLASDTPTAPSLAEPLLEQLTTCTSGVPFSCRTSGSLIGCTIGPSASALEVKRHSQQLQHNERHRMLLYTRNKLTSLGGAKGHMRGALETTGSEPPLQGWLQRVAAEGDGSKGVHPTYVKRTDPSMSEAATGLKSAARDAWSSAPAAPNTAFGDISSDTMPLASLLLSSLLSEETAKTAGSNASTSVGSRYTSRVVALLQTLSELQRRLASMQLPAQPPQQQSSRLGGEPAGEAKHSFSPPPPTVTTPHPREKLSPVQRAPNLNVPGILSSLLPALLQKADDRCESGGVEMRQRADASVQQQIFQQLQQRKQEIVDTAGGHGSWLTMKGENEWTAGMQGDPGPRGINCYGVGETSASTCVRRQEPADTPLALELVENFLKAQGLSGGCSGYPNERRSSLLNMSQDRGCDRSDRGGRQSSVAVGSQALVEVSIPRKLSGKRNNVGEAGSTPGTEDPPLVSHTDDKSVHVVNDELGKLHECRELQTPYARYRTSHGSQQRDRYGLDHLETVKKKNLHEEEPARHMESRAVNENKTAAVFADA